jgi:hypothetical protein
MPALNAKTASRRQDLDAGERQPSASTYSPWRQQQPGSTARVQTFVSNRLDPQRRRTGKPRYPHLKVFIPASLPGRSNWRTEVICETESLLVPLCANDR